MQQQSERFRLFPLWATGLIFALCLFLAPGTGAPRPAQAATQPPPDASQHWLAQADSDEAGESRRRLTPLSPRRALAAPTETDTPEASAEETAEAADGDEVDAETDAETDNAQVAPESLDARIAALRATPPLYADDFSSLSDDWSLAPDSNRHRLDTRMRRFWITIEDENILNRIISYRFETSELVEYLVEVSVAPTVATLQDDNNYGLVFRVIDTDNYFLYSMGAQVFSLRKLEGRQWQTLINWTETDAIQGGRRVANRMGVYVNQAQIVLLMNGEIVAQYEDAAFLDHDGPLHVGLAAGTFENAKVEVAFQDLALWAGNAPASDTAELDEAEVDDAQLDDTVSEEPEADEIEAATPETRVAPRRARAALPISSDADAEEDAGDEQTPDAGNESADAADDADDDADGATWVQFDADGLTLAHPDNWSVARDEQGRVDLHGPTGEQLTFWPLFLAQPVDAETAGLLLQALLAADLPQLDWSPAILLTPETVRMVHTDENLTAISSLMWINTPQGAALTYYLFVAPASSYAVQEASFVGILQSVQLTGSGVVDSGPQIAYTPWRDPVEGAFSTEVPAQDWRVEGGLLRQAPTSARGWLSLIQEERDLYVFVNDPELPIIYSTLTDLMAWVGMQEGTWTTTSSGTPMFISPYIPGVAYALEYVNTRWVAQGCTVTATQELTELQELLQAHMVSTPLSTLSQVWVHVGSVDFRCEADGQVYLGSVLAHTHLFHSDGIGVWTVLFLTGYLAPEGGVDEAVAILEHLMANWRTNPEWQAAQNRIHQAATQINIDTSREISQIISEGFANRMESEDRLSQSWSDMMHQVERVEDTRTGQVYEVMSGSNYHWIDNQGLILGTDAHFNPHGLHFEEMIKAP